jgi:hypothetical protein
MMADHQLIHFDEQTARTTNTIVLTTAIVLLIVLSIVILPLLAYLCEITTNTLNTPVPHLARYYFATPFWLVLLIAAVITAALLAKERFFRTTKWALWANVTSCLAILIAGALVVGVFSFPIYQTMEASWSF